MSNKTAIIGEPLEPEAVSVVDDGTGKKHLAVAPQRDATIIELMCEIADHLKAIRSHLASMTEEEDR